MKWVYFIRPIRMQGPVKIGCSRMVDRRLESLQTWSPFALEVVAQIAGGIDLERRFHARFYDSHERREWFTHTPALQAVIDAVAAGTFDVAALPPPRALGSDYIRNPWCEQTRAHMSWVTSARHAANRVRRIVGAPIYPPADPSLRQAFLDEPLIFGLSCIEAHPETPATARWLSETVYQDRQRYHEIICEARRRPEAVAATSRAPDPRRPLSPAAQQAA